MRRSSVGWPRAFGGSRRRYANVTFHAQRDFDWEEKRGSVVVPAFVEQGEPSAAAAAATQEANWDCLYRTHNKSHSHLFKPRNYLMHQFPALHTAQRVLEIGCGNGSSSVPILRSTNARVHSTDTSATAVRLTREAVEGVAVQTAAARLESRHTAEVQAADGPIGGPLHGLFDAALLVFTLSAVPRPGEAQLVKRVADALQPGGRLLFRDCAAHHGHEDPFAQLPSFLTDCACLCMHRRRLRPKNASRPRSNSRCTRAAELATRPKRASGSFGGSTDAVSREGVSAAGRHVPTLLQ